MPFKRFLVVALVAGCASAGSSTSSHGNNELASCDAFTVLSEQPNISTVQLDDAYAYVQWNDDAGNFTIGRMPKQGGELETIVSGSTVVRWILADGYVVYATPRTQVGPWDLWRVPVDGSDVPQQIFEASEFTDLATAPDGEIYWRVDTNIARVAIDGSGFEYLGGFDRVSYFVPDSDALYYMRPVDATLRQLWKFEYGTTSPKMIATIAPKADDYLAQNATSLFWVEWDGGKGHLATVAKTGGSPTRLATSTDDGMYDPVATDSVVVWQEFVGGDGATGIFELPFGGTAHQLVPDSCITGEWGDSIALDDTNIFLAGMRDDPPPIPTLRRGAL